MLGDSKITKSYNPTKDQHDNDLNEANLFCQQIINSALNGIVVYGKDLRYKVWNPFMEIISGVSAGEVIGKHPLETFPFLKECGVIERLEGALAGKAQETVDFAYKVPQTGREGWVSDTSGPLQNDKGEVIGVIGIVQDTTKRKEAEDALRASEERMSLVLAGSNDAFWDMDIATGKVEYGARFDEITGYSHSELNIEMWKKSIHHNDRDTYNNSLYDHIYRGAPSYEAEYRIQTKTGEWKWLLDRGKVTAENADGTPKRMTGTFTDITHRKTVEEQLRIERNKLELITENVGAGLAIISLEYRTIWANKVLKEIYGDVEDKCCYFEYFKKSCVCAGCGVRKILKTGADRATHEQLTFDGKGNEIWWELTATPLKDEKGNVTAALELALPITERKIAEKALLESEAKFREIFETSPVGILLCDADGKAVSANPACLYIFGFENVESIIGITFFDSPNVPAEMKELARGGETVEAEIAYDFNKSFITGYMPTNKTGVAFLNITITPFMEIGASTPRGYMLQTVDRTEQKLTESKIREMSHRTTALLENERKRIAHELHDEIGQKLTVLLLEINFMKKNLRNREDIEQFNAIISTAGSIGSEIQRICEGLRPMTLDAFGLEYAVNQLLEKVENTYGVKIESDIGPIAKDEIDGAAATTIYRILQEALTNIKRHSGAAVASVSLNRDADTGDCVMIIEDGGVGFQPGNFEKQGGFGILGMKERAAQCGGTLEIESAPGKGVKLRLTIPGCAKGPLP